jgi:hypothetical protein
VLLAISTPIKSEIICRTKSIPQHRIITKPRTLPMFHCSILHRVHSPHLYISPNPHTQPKLRPTSLTLTITVIKVASSITAVIDAFSNLEADDIGAVLMGGGFSMSEYDEAVASNPNIKSVPWFRVQPPPAGSAVRGPPPASELANRIRSPLMSILEI